MDQSTAAGRRPQQSSAHTALGRFGEDVAARWLQDQGYEIVDRNWRCPDGELDLVGIHQGWWVAVEVKTRRGLGYGHPFEAINPRKLRRLYRLSLQWAAAHPDLRRLAGWRVDAVSVLLPAGGGLTVEVLKDIRP
ncbi:YraN family protein [Citricoccus sp.]|uniref:YraN family protein n=1 Tax=Citricoccus sp. TaxID=1978372 RepID=UPI0028BE83BC|nr:YraN family protein [Citricoccus sp.]